MSCAPRRHTCRGFLLHFDKVCAALVVQLPVAFVEQTNPQFAFQVSLHLTNLQRPDTVGAVHRELLLVVGAVGGLPTDPQTVRSTRSGAGCV